MFKKLIQQKISDNPSPQKDVLSPAQAQFSSGERHVKQLGLHQDAPSSTSETVTKGKEGSSPSASVNGDGVASPMKEESQSLTQKLQQRVSSVESLLWGSGRVEGLFRTGSRDSLARSASRESLNLLGDSEVSGASAYDPSSDIESEAEDVTGNMEALSKEQLLHRLQKMERSVAKYRGKYSELLTSYRTVQRDKEKTQSILSQSQDKALRRIGELREELQMDQQAKKHLQEEFDAVLEEKDQMITVLQTQVALMKKRLTGGSEASIPPEEGDTQASELLAASPDAHDSAQPENLELNDAGGSNEPGTTVDLEALQKRVQRQEKLLQRCKHLINTNKEHNAQLSSENETLQQQLQERLQELEKIKELHSSEKTKLITQLGDAKNHIEQLEQDKGMVIAETKRQMHETLEMKEEEIAQLRSRMQQTVAQKEELQEQREKAEKAAFEELERALGVAQRAEEARRQLQDNMEAQIKEVERASEKERKILQQELTKVKQEVVAIMKKSTEDRIAETERLHKEALAKKDEEISAQIMQAVENCREELLQSTQEKEQQASLALEEIALQKSALQAEWEEKGKELQLELESARTRILELESTLANSSQEEATQTNPLSTEIEEQRNKYEAEIACIEEKHQQNLERVKEEQTNALNQLHCLAVEQLVQKHKSEIETMLKDKEIEFHAHVEDMNKKTLEKLESKQTELDELSLELGEIQNCKRQLEEKLASIDSIKESAALEVEMKLKEEKHQLQTELENMKHQHEQYLQEMENNLKELTNLKTILDMKDKELEQYVSRGIILEETATKAQQDVMTNLKELEDLRNIAQSDKHAVTEARAKLSSLQEELAQSNTQLQNVEMLLEAVRKDCQQKDDHVLQMNKKNEELQQTLQQAMNDLADKENLYAQTSKAMQEEQNQLKKQLEDEKASHEKRFETLKQEMNNRLKSQEGKIEKIKQKSKEMNEKMKKKLQEQQENAKAELAKKEKEVQEKDQQLKDKIIEMAQAKSEDLSSAMTDLQTNHNKQIEKLQEVHRQEQEDLLQLWQEKLSHLQEEMQESNTLSVQEKVSELEEISQQLLICKEEKELVVQEVKKLKEELAIKATTVLKLQAELKEAAVKLENLTEVQDMLRNQVETVEKNLKQALNERNLFQDQLSKAEETSKEKLQSLFQELQDTRKKLEVLEVTGSTECDNLTRILEEKTTELQSKEGLFLTQMSVISKDLEHHCQGAQAMLNEFSNDLFSKVENKFSELQNRIIDGQMKLCNLKNVILKKNNKICHLEEALQQSTEESQTLKISLDQMSVQRNENSENLAALKLEKNLLQKDANAFSQVLSEKDCCLEKLKEEKKDISEKLETNLLHISNLEGVIGDLKNQLASSITEKNEAISLLNQQHNEEKESLRNEKRLAQEQADTLSNKLSDLTKENETKFIQNLDTLSSLHGKMENMERQILEKEENLQRLTAIIDNQSISKSEMDQVLSEKEQRISALTLDLENCTKMMFGLQEQLELRTNEREQLVAELEQQRILQEKEKLDLVQQLQEAKEQSSQMSDVAQKTEEKLVSLERESQETKHQIECQQKDFEREKEDIIKSREQALKAAEDSLGKLAELKKKAEQKISLIRKQLTSQIEQKEQTIKDLQAQLEEMRRIQSEKELQIKNTLLTTKENLPEECPEEKADNTETEKESEALSRLMELETRLAESEELRATQQAKITDLVTELFKQTSLIEELQKTCSSLELQATYSEPNAVQEEACSVKQMTSLLEVEQVGSMFIKAGDADSNNETWKHEKELLVKEYEMKLQDLNKQLAIKNDMLQSEYVQTADEGSAHNTKGFENDLQRKLEDAENEKQRIHKDHVRLQKDLRSLRKEHEKELEYLKKEMATESEKNLKVEMEDLEMKHNSTLKQMMREFNTQMAIKEKELEDAVKEAIGKAQIVEAELLESHKEETIQLQKLMTQKDDDLKRTVQRYEEVLQSREEEMSARVWEIQKELEELQQRSLNTPQGIDELKVQLAEKTSLLSEARLKEQEYRDRIHTLEDTIRGSYKNSVVTHLGSPPRESSQYSADHLFESTEYEYLRKVLFEYMMGRETKTMAKVITSMLQFTPDQAQKVLEREDSRVMPWLR